MLNKFGSAVVIAAALFCGANAMADELSEAYAKGLEQFRAENYEAALPHFQESLKLAEARYGSTDARVAVELNNLAEVYRLLGDFDAAEPLYKRALELDEANLDPSNPDLATSLNNLALLYRAQDKLAEAEELYERSLSILQNALGPKHPNVAKSMNNLAVLYDAQGRRHEAVAMIEQAVGISNDTLGPSHPTTITLRSNLDTMAIEGPVTAVAEAGSGQTQETAGQTQTAANQASIEPAAGGDFVVHLASVRTSSAAADEWRRLTGLYELPAGLQQREPLRVTTANGDFYRVWGGSFANEAAASRVCETITAKGDYCKVLKIN